jgi:DNA polymerase III epsilon subunit-like protein
MHVLVFDTETTGLPDFSKPADDPCQPRMIQLAAQLYDADRELVGVAHHLVRPDGWEMPAELAEKMGHGLTQNRLLADGVPVAKALEAWAPLHDRADVLVGFGVDFDLKILRGELRRAGMEDRYGAVAKCCVMRACRSLCEIPMPSGRNGFKLPKLTEAVAILLKRDLTDAHNAMADCAATADLFYYLVRIGKGPSQQQPRPSVAPPAAPTTDDDPGADLFG